MREKKSGSIELFKHLDELSSYLTKNELDNNTIFYKPLDIMRRELKFDVSILYKISNVIDDNAIIIVEKKFDPQNLRPELTEGKKVLINLKNPDKLFVNEANAILKREISSVNIPGPGCDIVGFIFMPEISESYLFGGDYVGEESKIRRFEANMCNIMCNMLSSILMKSQYKKLAVNDELTGLLNSRAIRLELEKSIARMYRKTSVHLSIVLCDIDYFKKVNDTYGHIQGDIVLSETGGLINSSMRQYFDIAGRYGGEEFLMILEDTDYKTAMVVAERLRKKLEVHEFPRIDKNGNIMQNRHINITMSFGVATFNQNNKKENTAERMMSKVDRALYIAKDNGRNCVKGTKESQ